MRRNMHVTILLLKDAISPVNYHWLAEDHTSPFLTARHCEHLASSCCTLLLSFSNHDVRLLQLTMVSHWGVHCISDENMLHPICIKPLYIDKLFNVFLTLNPKEKLCLKCGQHRKIHIMFEGLMFMWELKGWYIFTNDRVLGKQVFFRDTSPYHSLMPKQYLDVWIS